jgi:hypothetical protein
MKQICTPGLILNAESTCDWRADELTAPVNNFVSHPIRNGKLPLNLSFKPQTRPKR